MDFGTLIGLVLAIGILGVVAHLGGDVALLVDPVSFLLVAGGTLAVTLMKFPPGEFLRSFGVAARAFAHRRMPPRPLLDEAMKLAHTARKNGLLALEKSTIANPFLKRAIALCVDGHEPALVSRMLSTELSLAIERQETAVRVFRSLGEVAPAMGMIGTLIGLTGMLAQLDDPTRIGPAMALALLTTLYGALIAHAIALPIADKLDHIGTEERIARELIVETVAGIQEGLNPRALEELLKGYLPEHERAPVKREVA